MVYFDINRFKFENINYIRNLLVREMEGINFENRRI